MRAASASSSDAARLRRRTQPSPPPRSSPSSGSPSVGLKAEIVSQRLNRRKIDLIPEPDWADPAKARIGELLAAVEARLAEHGFADLREVVDLAVEAAREAGLAEPRVTSDAKHVEIGLTDKSDSGRWIFAQLWRRGIGAGSVLVAGDEFGRLGGLPGSDSLLLVPEAARATIVSVGVEPTGVPEGVILIGGGPPLFLGLLEEQIERRRRGEVPGLEPEPGWALAVEGFDPHLERVHESQFALADGRLGTRGSLLVEHHAARPAVQVAGLYDGEGVQTHLLTCPLWNRLRLPLERGVTASRVLDLHTGLLRQQVQKGRNSLDAISFSSLARPGTAVLRAFGSTPLVPFGPALVAPRGRKRSQMGAAAGRAWMSVQGSGGDVSAIASERRSAPQRGRASLERIVVYEQGDAEAALPRVNDAEQAGLERLLVEQRSAWAGRWEDADVAIEGDPELQLAVRFALFHLMASVADDRRGGGRRARAQRPGLPGACLLGQRRLRAAVPRGDAPAGGAGDARVPNPPASGRAKQRRRSWADAGARFPWESAATARDVTPTHARLPHRDGRAASEPASSKSTSSADVAWAAACYSDWTGDEEFAAGPGRDLLVETARYWASRIRLDPRGTRPHLRGDRPRRVPRARGRQRLHERDGALEPAPRGRIAQTALAPRGTRALAARSPMRSSTATNLETGRLRAVRRLLRARAARDRRGRAAATDRRRPAARPRARTAEPR